LTVAVAAALAAAGAGLLGASATTGRGGGGGGAVEVAISVHHSHFEPSAVHVRRGTTVRFVVHNTDPIDHELIVGPAAVQDRHEHGTEAHHGDVDGEISVPAGAVRVTTYRFGSAGSVPFACHLPGHWAYGMSGVVTVG
jgi:uncharacterized cupredoxin-like copper-binding protein